MHRRLQFGMRENPGSDRRHGSRFAVGTKSNPHFVGKENAKVENTITLATSASGALHSPTVVAENQAAARGNEDNRLLTIQQVADILHVPVSWVYGRTRRRSTERLPGIRLGKYWRFRKEEIHRWIERQREGHRVP